MYDPKEVLTKWGLEEHRGHVFNLKRAIFYFINNADDLHIGANGDKQIDVLYDMQELLDSHFLENGDGEKDETS